MLDSGHTSRELNVTDTPEGNQPGKGWDANSPLYNPTHLLNVQLCVSLDDQDHAIRAARYWLTNGFETLGGALRETVRRSTPEQLDLDRNVLRRNPGDVSANVATSTRHEDGELSWSRPYSEQTWAELLDRVGRVPDTAVLSISTTAEDEWLTGPSFEASLGRAEREWLELDVQLEADQVASIEQQDAVVAFLNRAADDCNPCHGEIVWNQAGRRTALEAALNLTTAKTLPTARQVLRGYSWVTIIPEEIGQRLGGVDALLRSEAFTNVTRLGAGGYFLRATQDLRDYKDAAVLKVFNALRSVLPPGMPNLRYVVPPAVIAPADAAEAEARP